MEQSPSSMTAVALTMRPAALMCSLLDDSIVAAYVLRCQLMELVSEEERISADNCMSCGAIFWESVIEIDARQGPQSALWRSSCQRSRSWTE
jgi:hypothetical protein